MRSHPASVALWNYMIGGLCLREGGCWESWGLGQHPRGSRLGGVLADNSFTHLVVVGASAGGIEALSELVSALPEDLPAPIVVAQHLDPKRESHLEEILSRRSPLPVKTVTDREPLQPGVVFVVPANRHVSITDSEIDLSPSRPRAGPCHPWTC